MCRQRAESKEQRAKSKEKGTQRSKPAKSGGKSEKAEARTMHESRKQGSRGARKRV
jgi:hypothetical protein